MKFYKTNHQTNEQGIVSIIVTVVLMLVISLIVIAFARSSRRAERDSLDRQLSTNAFYAAESGVNAARKAIDQDATQGLLSKAYTTNCTGPGSFAADAGITIPSNDIGANGSNAKFTCLFVNPAVADIQRNPSNDPYAFQLRNATGGGVGSVQFYWDAGKGSTARFDGCPDPGTNQTILSNCNSSILRIELVPTSNTNTSYVYYAYPNDGPIGSFQYGSSATGSTASGRCTATPAAANLRQCVVNITSLSEPVLVHVSSIYDQFGLTVVPTDPAVRFTGAQVMIDATGRAADVQRRIQIRYTPASFGGPVAALQLGASLCKQFTVDGTNVSDKSAPACWPAPGIYSNGTGTSLP